MPPAPRLAKRASRSTDLIEEIRELIARSRRIIFAGAARRLETSGESIPAWRVLAHLVRCGPTAQCELAAAIGQHAACVSRLIDELEAQGVVRRRRDPEDRRKVLVGTTSAGRARFEAHRPAVNEVVERHLSHLDRAERMKLRDLLGKLGD